MTSKTKANHSERVKSELVVHDQWVADCEQRRKAEKSTKAPRTVRAAKTVRKTTK